MCYSERMANPDDPIDLNKLDDFFARQRLEDNLERGGGGDLPEAEEEPDGTEGDKIETLLTKAELLDKLNLHQKPGRGPGLN